MTTVNLTRVAELLNAGGTHAFIENTGGGTMCLFAGPARDNPDSWPDMLRAAIAGPAYDGTDGTTFADLSEFYLGPELDGESVTISPGDVGAVLPEQVALLVAAQVRATHAAGATDTKPAALDADTLERLGFDSTGRA